MLTAERVPPTAAERPPAVNARPNVAQLRMSVRRSLRNTAHQLAAQRVIFKPSAFPS